MLILTGNIYNFINKEHIGILDQEYSKRIPYSEIMEKRILTYAKKAKSIEKLRDILYDPDILKIRGDYRGLNILLLNTPCNGFGDLIFALKLSKILEYYFSASVKIATTLPKALIKIGALSVNVYKLASTFSVPESSKRSSQCRRYATLKVYYPEDTINAGKLVDTSVFDLFFDAPLMADYDPSLSNIKKVVPTANKFNTFFFSEYNDYLDKNFDFNMGIGKGRNGMLFLPRPLRIIMGKDYIANILEIFGKFCLIYIADIPGWEKCMYNFISMVLEKYGGKRTFTIICPSFTVNFVKKRIRKLFKLYPYFSNIIIVEKGENGKRETQYNDLGGNSGNNRDNKNNGKTLTIRGDILPTNNSVILALMKYSVRDILLTGDQSITDMLMVSSRKNIFYQIARWKRDFGKELGKLMPQKYLMKMTTACGTMNALKYNGNYSKFIRDWSFIKKSNKKLRQILIIASILKDIEKNGENKNSKFLAEYTDIVNNSKTLNSALNKLGI